MGGNKRRSGRITLFAMIVYRFAADAIVVVHALFVLYVVLTQVLILIGAFRR